MKYAPAYFSFTNPQARAYARDVAAYIAGLQYLRATEDEAFDSRWESTWVDRLAAHETGHAIAALSLGIEVKRVYVKDRYGAVEGKDGTLFCHVDFADLEQTATALIVMSAGYVGEMVLFNAEATAGVHEIAFLIYTAQLIEAHHGIQATQALRATLAVCERVIRESRAGAKLLQEKLLRDRRANAEDVKRYFPEISTASVEEWLTLARSGAAKHYPEVERLLVIGGALASAAWPIYAEEAAA